MAVAIKMNKIDIKDLLLEDLEKKINSLGIERFRAQQVLSWIYKRYINDFNEMTNLSAELKEKLKVSFCINDLHMLKELKSEDGTKKFLFMLEDKENIESVFIPSRKTSTICISSQVGCKFSCRFCASGKGGFRRNLKPAEMIDQVLFLRKAGLDVTNVVFMGMGEPLDNYDNVLKAVRILNASYGLGIGQRKITISTCGLVPEIKNLAQEGLQIELSISLHSPNDKTRSMLMGINNKYPLGDLIGACKDYIDKTNRQVTFEYVLIAGVNDSKKDARDLTVLLKGMLAKVNLIAFNPVEGLDYISPSKNSIREFKDLLDAKGIVSTVRSPRGPDIDAACGQLRLRYEI